MEKGGGRPKAVDVWEHVMPLEGKRKVKCKYCGFEFVGSANRIKSHLLQIKGHGIRLCPNFPPSNNLPSTQGVSYDLKQNLLHSPGLSISNRLKDDEKLNETMPDDCYMSPKTMWEGLTSHQQLQINTKAEHHERPRDDNELKETMLDCYMCPKTMWEGIVAHQQLQTNQKVKHHERPRDYNNLKKTKLDCYMSPATMWEGINTLQQVQSHKETKHQERIQAGPFLFSTTLNEHDSRLIQYIFQHLRDTDRVFSSSRSYLNQSEFATLKPRTVLDSMVIDIFAEILTDIERNKKAMPSHWYLPVTFSKAALNDDLSCLVNFVEQHCMRENYMSNLLDCEKIFIPIHVGTNSHGHFYLYIIHLKNKEVVIWDSLSDQFINKIQRDEITQKLLLAMDRLFVDAMFTKFRRRMANNIPLQPNGYDCGVFVINFMQQSDNYVRRNPLCQFDSDEERLDLALKLLNSDLNQERETLYDKAARRHYAQGENEGVDFSGIKRERVYTSKTFSEDVGREPDLEYDDSNRRVRRHVGLEKDLFSSIPMNLPPGFTFHPSDEELVSYYLERKITGSSSELQMIPEVDLYKCEPWDLPGKSFLPSKDMEWYFYSPRDRKYPNGSRTNRATRAGYWKATGKDRPVISCQRRSVGMKKTLVYYKGRAPHGIRTNWVMHEYRLIDSEPGNSFSSLKDSYSLCRVSKETFLRSESHETKEAKKESVGPWVNYEEVVNHCDQSNKVPNGDASSSDLTQGTPFETGVIYDFEARFASDHEANSAANSFSLGTMKDPSDQVLANICCDASSDLSQGTMGDEFKAQFSSDEANSAANPYNALPFMDPFYDQHYWKWFDW